MVALDEKSEAKIGHGGLVHREGDLFCAIFEVGDDFYAFCCENAVCLRHWVMRVIKDEYPDWKDEAWLGIGEAATNAFKHCKIPEEGAKLAVSAKVTFDKCHRIAGIELINLGTECPNGLCDIPMDTMSQEKRGLPIIKALQDAGILTDVRFESIQLEGHEAVKFSCNVPCG